MCKTITQSIPQIPETTFVSNALLSSFFVLSFDVVETFHRYKHIGDSIANCAEPIVVPSDRVKHILGKYMLTLLAQPGAVSIVTSCHSLRAALPIAQQCFLSNPIRMNKTDAHHFCPPSPGSTTAQRAATALLLLLFICPGYLFPYCQLVLSPADTAGYFEFNQSL